MYVLPDSKQGKAEGHTIKVMKQQPETRRGRVTADLKARIERGVWQAGERLPSMSVLGEEYRTSDITIRAVIKQLSDEGYVIPRRGSGVYVRARRDTFEPVDEKRIALLIAAWDSPFYAGIVSGAEEQCRALGYRLMPVSSSYDPQLEARHLRELIGQVEGLLIVPLPGGDYSAYAELLRRRTPFVFIDSYVEGLAAPLVATDNEAGGYQVTRYLIEQGRQRIWAIASGQGHTSFEERLQGYRRALREAGIAFDPDLVLRSSKHSQWAGYSLTQSLIPRLEDKVPSAIFALNDSVARGCYIALKEGGMSIPSDIAVAGFDDLDAAFFDPPLTSVHQSTAELGAGAARVLLENLMFGTLPPAPVRLMPQLMVRQSSDLGCDFNLVRYLAQRPAKRFAALHNQISVPAAT